MCTAKKRCTQERVICSLADGALAAVHVRRRRRRHHVVLRLGHGRAEQGWLQHRLRPHLQNDQQEGAPVVRNASFSIYSFSPPNFNVKNRRRTSFTCSRPPSWSVSLSRFVEVTNKTEGWGWKQVIWRCPVLASWLFFVVSLPTNILKAIVMFLCSGLPWQLPNLRGSSWPINQVRWVLVAS